MPPGDTSTWSGLAWQAWSAAKGELRLALDSVIDDLEGLTHVMRSDHNTGVIASPRPQGTAPTRADDDESMRLDDLCAPSPRRAEYEQVPEPPAVHDGFELIDFETEADIVAFT